MNHDDQGRQAPIAALELLLQASLHHAQTIQTGTRKTAPEWDGGSLSQDDLQRPVSPEVGSTVTSSTCSPRLTEPTWMERIKRSRNILAFEIIPVSPAPECGAAEPLVIHPGVSAQTETAPCLAQPSHTPPRDDSVGGIPEKESSPGVQQTSNSLPTDVTNDALGKTVLNVVDKTRIDTLPVSRLKHFRRYDCTRCEKLFHTSRDLRQHVDVVHDKNKPFACELCPRTFGLKGNLVKHCLNKHSSAGARALVPCPYCDRCFSMKGNLKKHVETVHHRLRPFVCTLCPAKFSRRGNLNQHCRMVHGTPTGGGVEATKVTCKMS